MAKDRTTRRNAESGGLWHQPGLLNLFSDVLIALSIAALTWSALTVLQRLPLFALREVVLAEKPQRVSTEHIAHVARTTAAGNFFSIDLEAIRTAIEKLPWVRNAAVRRHWPDGLALSIEEHEAVAHWRHLNSEPGLVNKQGEVFLADLPEDSPILPRLGGPDGTAAEILARHSEFDRAVAHMGRSVTAIDLSPRRAWRLWLDDDTVIELGRDEERHPLTERLARFVAYYDSVKLQLGTIRIADMRYPNGFALAGIERASLPPLPPTAGRKS